MNFRRVETLENLLYCHFLSSIHSIEPITCGGYFFAYFFILDVPVLWICSCHITVQMHWAYLIWKYFEHFTLNKVHNAKGEKTEKSQLTQRIRIYRERDDGVVVGIYSYLLLFDLVSLQCVIKIDLIETLYQSIYIFNINILWSSSADDIEHLNALFMYDAFYEVE